MADNDIPVAEEPAKTKTKAKVVADTPVVEQTVAAESPGEYFIGYWHEYRNYGCPQCEFSTLEGSGAVNAHIFTVHVQYTPPPAGLLGPDGRPL